MTNIATESRNARPTRSLDDYIWSLDLTPTQRVVLLALSEVGRRYGRIDQPQVVLCDLTHLSDRAVCITLNWLEQKGLIRRRMNPGRPSRIWIVVRL